MESLLKQVIIRIDFSPISNFMAFIMQLRNNPIMMEYYARGREIKTNNVNITLNQNKDELQDAKLTVNETTSVFRFYGETERFDQKSEFDITDSFMCLTIACDDNYKHCTPYLEFIADRMSEVKQFDPYARIKRIGLRKIDSDDFTDVEAANKIFVNVNAVYREKKNDDDQTRVRMKQNFSEQFFYEKQQAQMVSTQGFNGTVGNKLFRFVLDTDAFIEDGHIDHKTDDVLGYLKEKLSSLNEMLRENYEINISQDELKAYRNGRQQ